MSEKRKLTEFDDGEPPKRPRRSPFTSSYSCSRDDVPSADSDVDDGVSIITLSSCCSEDQPLFLDPSDGAYDGDVETDENESGCSYGCLPVAERTYLGGNSVEEEVLDFEDEDERNAAGLGAMQDLVQMRAPVQRSKDFLRALNNLIRSVMGRLDVPQLVTDLLELHDIRVNAGMDPLDLFYDQQIARNIDELYALSSDSGLSESDESSAPVQEDGHDFEDVNFVLDAIAAENERNAAGPGAIQDPAQMAAPVQRSDGFLRALNNMIRSVMGRLDVSRLASDLLEMHDLMIDNGMDPFDMFYDLEIVLKIDEIYALSSDSGLASNESSEMETDEDFSDFDFRFLEPRNSD